MSTSFISKLPLYIRRFLACVGPGYLVAVGYMDPGNWVTGLAGGSRYGYALLSVIFISNVMAIILQYCALKLGIVTGKDLARACRDYYSPVISKILWVLAELAIIATDLAEVIGSALGLQLLCGVPLVWGVCITAADVLLLLAFTHRRQKKLEFLVTVLIAAIIGCFSIILYLSHVQWDQVLGGFIPPSNLLYDSNMLYIAIGILGATVMPHNLYLHSYLVKDVRQHDDLSIKQSIFYRAIDICIALTFAFFVNASILIIAAAVFYERGLYGVAEIQDAYYLFTPLLKTSVASFVFALALLISGQNSTITGTLAGQVVMEGFMDFTIAPWKRRLLSRIVTIIPAIAGIAFFGECCLSHMLILSQVVLSLQLPFAVFPLVNFTSNSAIMGEQVNSRLLKICAFLIGAIIVYFNILLLYLLV